MLRPGASASEEAPRTFLGQRLAEFEFSQRLVAVDEISKGATGKIQRIGPAEKLAARLRPNFVAPRTPMEKLLARPWSEALGIGDLGTRDNLFFVGGDSLRVMAIIEAAAKAGVTLQTQQFATYPAVAGRAPRRGALRSLRRPAPGLAPRHAVHVPASE